MNYYWLLKLTHCSNTCFWCLSFVLKSWMFKIKDLRDHHQRCPEATARGDFASYSCPMRRLLFQNFMYSPFTSIVNVVILSVPSTLKRADNAAPLRTVHCRNLSCMKMEVLDTLCTIAGSETTAVWRFILPKFYSFLYRGGCFLTSEVPALYMHLLYPPVCTGHSSLGPAGFRPSDGVWQFLHLLIPHVPYTFSRFYKFCCYQHCKCTLKSLLGVAGA